MKTFGLASAVLAFLSVFAFTSNTNAQATFNIPFDTIYQECPPDTAFLYLYADSGASNGYTYDIIPYNTESVGGTTVSMSDDQIQGPFNIGFNFSFYCGIYSQFYICSNGWIGFSAGQTATWVVQSIPNTNNNTPKNNIMGPWRDWNPGTGGGGPYIRYQTQGTAPLRKLVVTWSNVPMYSCTSTTGTFQIVLHEASNIIHNNLTNVPTCLNWGNGDGTEGTHNQAGNLATPVAGRNDSQFTATNQSVRFIPTSPIVWTALNGTSLGIGNGLYASFSQSQWVHAAGYTCNGDSTFDSVYIAVSCIHLITDSVDVDCTGDATGMAIARDTSSQTQGPYTYRWYTSNMTLLAVHTSNDTVDTLFNVPAGDYKVYCYGINNNFSTGEITVNEPDTLNDATTSFIPVICNGTATGIGIAADPTNYSNMNWDGFYSYYWATSSGTLIDSTVNVTTNTNMLQGLAAGTYNVTVDGCLIHTGEVTITEPTIVTASITNETMTSCHGTGACDASAIANGNGGIPPYTFQWSGGEQWQTPNTLCAGYNYVTVTDANGCDTTAVVFIDEPDSIVTNAFGADLICITNVRQLTSTTSGGTAPYNHVWTSGSLTGPVVGTNQNVDVEPHVTTRFFVSTTDGNDCPGDTASVLIKVRPPLGLIVPPADTICPYDTIDVSAQGLGGDSIYTYSWSVGSMGPTAAVSPDLSEWFYVTVSDFCGTPSFVDSVFVQVGGYGGIRAKIRVEDDSICAGESQFVMAEAQGGFNGPQEYEWKWNIAGWKDHPVQFDQPAHTTMYIITVTDLCLSPEGIDTAYIYVGEPEMPTVEIGPKEACTSSTVTFSIDRMKDKYTYNWSFGDGKYNKNAKKTTFQHEYTGLGCYDVQLEVWTDFGCYASSEFPCAVKILQAPTASFIHTPDQPNTLEPFIKFTDVSEKAESIRWMMNGMEWRTDSTFQYEFIDTGRYEIALIAMSEDGCLDTTSVLLSNDMVTTLYIPTSFTPNGDGTNDVFMVMGEDLDPAHFELTIFDRWGEVMFYSKNPSFGWDGTMSANGQSAPIGTYAYVVKYLGRDSQPKMVTGQILLSKSGDALRLD